MMKSNSYTSGDNQFNTGNIRSERNEKRELENIEEINERDEGKHYKTKPTIYENSRRLDVKPYDCLRF